jgi:hypothetical protein
MNPVSKVALSLLLCFRCCSTQDVMAQRKAASEAASPKSPPIHSVASALRFSPDGRFLISAGAISRGDIGRYWAETDLPMDKRLRVWDVAHTREIQRLPAQPIGGFLHNSTTLLLPDFATMLTTWGAWEVKPIDVRTFRFKKFIEVRNGSIGSLAFQRQSAGDRCGA